MIFRPPNADDIARAIVAACRETGANPVDVVSGYREKGGTRADEYLKVSRARTYAAMALDTVFNPPQAGKTQVSRPTIARLVGVEKKSSQQAYLASIEQCRRIGTLVWWQPEAHARIVFAIGRGETRAPAMVPAVVRHSAPPPLVSQRTYVQIGKLLGELQPKRKPASAVVDVTATFCGDPPPGRSALDEKRGTP